MPTSKKTTSLAMPTKREHVDDSDDDEDEDEEEEEDEDEEEETEDVLSSSSMEATNNNILNSTTLAPHLPVRTITGASTSTSTARRRSSASAARRTKSNKDAESKSQPTGTKKTKGRVKIQMAFIDNKLRRYTTFSKRKAGLMKKAFELSTLTGTEVLLLVASETGHVYTFATTKLQPMIVSEAGKALIQTCLNSPEGNVAVSGAPPTLSGMSPSPPTRSGPSSSQTAASNTAYGPLQTSHHYNNSQQSHLLQQHQQNGHSGSMMPTYYNYADTTPLHGSLAAQFAAASSALGCANVDEHRTNGTARNPSPSSVPKFYSLNTNGDFKSANIKTDTENHSHQQQQQQQLRRESTSCSPASSSVSSDPLSHITPTLQLPPPPPRTPATSSTATAVESPSNTTLPPITASLLLPATPSTPRSAANTTPVRAKPQSHAVQQQQSTATSYPTMASMILDPLNCSTNMYTTGSSNHHSNPYQHVDMYGNIQQHHPQQQQLYQQQHSMNSFFDFANDDLLSFASPSLGLSNLTSQPQQQHMSTPLLSAATTGATVALGCNPFLTSTTSNSHDNQHFQQQHHLQQQLGTANGGGNLNSAGLIQLPAYAVLSQQTTLASSQRGGSVAQQHNNSQRELKDEMLPNFLLQ